LIFWRRRWHGLAGELFYRSKFWRTHIKAGTTLYAFLLVYHVNLVFASLDGFRGAISKANHTGLTVLRIYVVGYELFAGQGRASLLFDVGLIFVPEVAKSGKYWVGGSSSQGA
jgi:soluble lytic murein transglycosylase-like protein